MTEYEHITIEVPANIKQQIEDLCERDRLILNMFIVGYTQEEIGELLCVTQPRICQIFTDLLIKLRSSCPN